MPFVKANEAARYYNVSTATIRKYAREKSIHTEKLPSGQYRYWIEQHTNTESNQSNEKLTIAYARVSSYKQRYDLKRQIKYLKHVRPDASILFDIGSGLNNNRKNFKAIFQYLIQGNIKEVVVAHKDRLSRIGFSFFEWLFSLFGSKLTSLDTNRFSKTTGNQMLDEIMEIITVFTSRYYGLRKYSRRKNRRQICIKK
jgi:predicted site-specific integrase-resolvase